MIRRRHTISPTRPGSAPFVRVHRSMGTALAGVLLLIAVAAGPAAAQLITMGTPAGSIAVPRDWPVESRGDRVTTWSNDSDSTRVELYSVAGTDLNGFLQARADSLGIDRNVRSTSADFSEEVGASRGGFVLGTVPVAETAEALPSPPEYDTLDPAWVAENGDGVPAEYRFVAAYVKGRRLHVMEARSLDLNGAPNRLSDIHRSWIMPN